MKIGISEFTFGFAFLYESTIANWDNLIGFPVLPSLKDEQSKGYDAELPVEGTPFYYQFKLTEYLKRSDAAERLDKTHTGPYFRIKLHNRDCNLQHRLLWKLGQECADTYYVAPQVPTRAQFNDAFLNKSIIANSRMIRLSDCDELADTDEEQHVITFTETDPGSNFKSTPRRIQRTYRGKEIPALYESTRPRWRPVDDVFARHLLEQTIAAVRGIESRQKEQVISSERHLLESGVANVPRAKVLQRVADLTATVFGATMAIVGTRPKPTS
jgi:hypothetical protein